MESGTRFARIFKDDDACCSIVNACSDDDLQGVVDETHEAFLGNQPLGDEWEECLHDTLTSSPSATRQCTPGARRSTGTLSMSALNRMLHALQLRGDLAVSSVPRRPSNRRSRRSSRASATCRTRFRTAQIAADLAVCVELDPWDDDADSRRVGDCGRRVGRARNYQTPLCDLACVWVRGLLANQRQQAILHTLPGLKCGHAPHGRRLLPGVRLPRDAHVFLGAPLLHRGVRASASEGIHFQQWCYMTGDSSRKA